MKTKTILIILTLLLAMPAAVLSRPAVQCSSVLQSPQPSLKKLEDIVINARANGARWNVDEWKLHTRNALVVVAPLIKRMSDLQKLAEDNPDSVTVAMESAEALEQEMEPYTKLLDEFGTIAENTEAGKAVMEDDEWAVQVMRELGIPEFISSPSTWDDDVEVDTVSIYDGTIEIDSIGYPIVSEELQRLEDIVTRARTESAQWTEEEWKANLRFAMLAIAPLLKQVQDYQEMIGDDETKAAEHINELSSLLEVFEPYQKLFDELDALANASEIGKAILEDPEWEKEVTEELSRMGIEL